MSAPKLKIELNAPPFCEEWEAYVYNHPGGTLFHLPQWKEVLEDTFHYSPFYLFAEDGNAKLCGILPLFQVKSFLTGNRLVSLPFSNTCGPIADSDYIVGELVNWAKRLYHKLKCSYLELRMMEPNNFGFETNDYFSTYALELSDMKDEVWKKMDAKNIRRPVNKARKLGVTIHRANTLAELKVFYFGLNQKHKRDLGVPVHPYEYYKSAYQHLKPYCDLYLAEKDGKVVSGIFNVKYKDAIFYLCGASNITYLKYHCNKLTFWEAITDACGEGYRYFNFGKTSGGNKGLIRFKSDWGSEAQKLYFHYYPKIPKSLWLNREGVMARLITSVWTKLPVPFATWLSKFAFKHLE